MEFNVNQNLCSKCRLCIEVCPSNLIGINEEGETNFIPERLSICLKCGQCMAICSTQAIQIEALSYDTHFKSLKKTNINYPDFVNFLSSRRSIRNFKDQAIPKELIRNLLDSLSYVPFGAAPEKGQISVINNRNQIEKALPFIESFLDHIVPWVDNPFSAYVIKRKKGLETFNTLKNHLYPIVKLNNYKLRYGDRITRNAPAILIFHAPKGAEEHSHNALINATYLMLGAHALGLGASMNGLVPGAINKVKEVRECFNIPLENEAVIALTLGYPKYRYKRTIRRPLPKTIWVD